MSVEMSVAKFTIAGGPERTLLLPDGIRLGATRITMLAVRPPYATDPDFTEIAIYHEEDRDGHDFHDYEVDVPVGIGGQAVESITAWLGNPNGAQTLDLQELLEQLDAAVAPQEPEAS